MRKLARFKKFEKIEKYRLPFFFFVPFSLSNLTRHGKALTFRIHLHCCNFFSFFLQTRILVRFSKKIVLSQGRISQTRYQAYTLHTRVMFLVQYILRIATLHRAMWVLLNLTRRSKVLLYMINEVMWVRRLWDHFFLKKICLRFVHFIHSIHIRYSRFIYHRNSSERKIKKNRGSLQHLIVHPLTAISNQ